MTIFYEFNDAVETTLKGYYFVTKDFHHIETEATVKYGYAIQEETGYEKIRDNLRSGNRERYLLAVPEPWTYQQARVTGRISRRGAFSNVRKCLWLSRMTCIRSRDGQKALTPLCYVVLYFKYNILAS